MDDLISICIPAYKRPHYLKRLLDSIATQSYKAFEVVITDDSGEDDSVEKLANKYSSAFPVTYHRNTPALGTPRNWMAGIALAKGEWIKMVHDDDWFVDGDSLHSFAAAAQKNSSARLIFSGYTAFYEGTDKRVDKTITQRAFKRILHSPYLLFAENKLGPPSVLMFHKSIKEYYDEELKWFVDIEYYVRMLQKLPAVYIDRPLIYMSYNDTQVTKGCFNNPVVEIPEAIHIINRHGSIAAKGLLVYDAWWRTLRNGEVLSAEKLATYARGHKIPELLLRMAGHMEKIPRSLLKQGAFSKLAMTFSYLMNNRKAG